jgi:hypothetical protein
MRVSLAGELPDASMASIGPGVPGIMQDGIVTHAVNLGLDQLEAPAWRS